MRYELMLPYQIRKAIAARWPIVLPVGVLEYHGEHLGLGMDTLAVIRTLEAIEQHADIVVMPAFYYGAASNAVVAPQSNGTLHVGAQSLLSVARDLFGALLRVGFRNIHFVIHHQTENFAAGMPTDLAFKLAAREAIFEHLESERGSGWWGGAAMADYYARQANADDPFNWIKGHPLMSREAIAAFGFDHAGKLETSLMMALCPEAVDMRQPVNGAWYTASAADATSDFGLRARDAIVLGLQQALGIELDR